jgi:ribonuclease D
MPMPPNTLTPSQTVDDSEDAVVAEITAALVLPTELPPYPGLSPHQIHLVRSEAEVSKAAHALLNADVVGFDTESKPIFNKGQRSDGPHLIQLATDQAAYLFPCVTADDVQFSNDLLRSVLESEQILKVGFGLRDDNKRLKAKLGIELAKVLDLSRAMRESKYREMGAKAAVAKYFGQALQKSKKISTSNWSLAPLNDRQLKYAADDAQVALLTYRAWLVAGRSSK